jgi:proline iminopeptidase
MRGAVLVSAVLGLVVAWGLFGSVWSGGITLWPEIEPYRTDYLRVSDIHKIYYELCGDPEGKPVFVLHGGPGGSSSPYMRRFFNPEKFLIVLHDQRGAGQSTPPAEIRENTTQHLVEDIERLREHLGAGKIILFGGSWGATLALAYAETYPGNVAGMVLRGVFTATGEEIDHFYHGGVRTAFPDTYDRFVNSLPEPDRRPLPDYLLALVQSEDPEERAKYSRVWAAYELKLASLEFPDEDLERVLDEFDSYTFALMENHYMANGCFFEEGQLLENADRIREIPSVLVTGRYDMICPPINAYRLHKLLPGSRLVIAEGAGHWMGEEAVERALLVAMREFE